MDPAGPSTPAAADAAPQSPSEQSPAPSAGEVRCTAFVNSVVTPTGTRHPLEDVSLTPDNFSHRSVSPTTVLTVDSTQSCFTISEDLTEYIEDQRSAARLQSNYRVFGRTRTSMGDFVVADRGTWKSRLRDFAGVSLLDVEPKRARVELGSSARGSLDSITEDDALQRQRVLYEEKYYLNLIKTNLWLSMVSKGGELATSAVTGFKDGFSSWLSNALQLAFNVLSSCFLLWRYKGKYSTSRTEAAKHRVRERLSIFLQSFCKLCGAATLLTYAVLVLAGKIDHLPDQTDINFIRMSMLNGGVSTSGSLTRAALACWTSWLLLKPLPSSTKSISSENKLTWINTVLSLKTAVVSFYMSYAGDNPAEITKVMKYSNCIDIIIGVVSVYYGVIDLLLGYRDRQLEKSEQDIPDQTGDVYNEIDTADHSAPQQKELVF